MDKTSLRIALFCLCLCAFISCLGLIIVVLESQPIPEKLIELILVIIAIIGAFLTPSPLQK
jgi:Mn2+/Fe2+ NRAMP family transporter